MSSEPELNDATILLGRAARGDGEAEKVLTSLAYHRLRELAAGYLRRERPDHTLEPTALVHEAYLRLVDQSKVDWNDRTFFLALGAREMRRVLIDHARSRKRIKRGGGWARVLLEQVAIPVEGREIDILDIDEALRKLSFLEQRQAQVVELRFFAGLSVEETARSLDVSPKTVEKDWRLARAWLYRYLNETDDTSRDKREGPA